MKPKSKFHFGAVGLSMRSERGVALVLVLGFLVLLTGLVVAFFTSVTTELADANSYGNGAATKLLADTAVNMVMAQIKTATTGTNIAWASQPGMIRTYGDASGNASSSPLIYYKLYSSDNMQVISDFSTWLSSGNDLKVKPGAGNVTDWVNQPAIFTDLNAPVVSGTTPIYPIVDPTANVEGFSLNGSNNPSASTANANKAPMPVKWIYVLKDGTLTAPANVDATGKIASWSGSRQPSSTNPIVGRVAFWTDDESCKLNLNTASEPTPWDTPRAVTSQDLKFGLYQPAYKEYQRFPGHPFMNALSPVLYPSPDPSHPTPVTTAQKQAIYSLIPRVAWGGSQAATVAATSAVVPDQDRLFASADEAFFTYPLASGASRPLATSLIPQMTPQAVQQARFFLTANSRAPELNLYGQPRVSLWPEHKTSTWRTAFDKLAAFCTTTGTGSSASVYYFDRYDPTSPTTDYTGSPRNKKLYTYLQNLTTQPIPGYGGNFATKWGTDRDQILTEIFDYIRCVNLNDPQLQASNKSYAPNGQVAPIYISSNDTQGFGRFHTVSQAGFHFICAQSGTMGAVDSNNPALSGSTRAIEAAFIFSPFCPSEGWYQLQEQLYFDVKFTTPFTINGQDLKMQAGGGALNDNIGNTWHGRRDGGPGGIRAAIVALGGGGYKLVSKAVPRVKITDPSAPMEFSGGTVVMNVYAGTAAGSANLVQTITFTFPPGKFPVPSLVSAGTDVYRGAAATGASDWWTISKRYANATNCPQAPGPEYTNPARRFTNSSGPPGFKQGSLFRAEDVVRTLVPDHGDFRLIAAQHNVSADQFVPVTGTAGWNNTTQAASFEHIFSSVTGTQHLFGFCNEPGVATNPAVVIPTTAADQFFGGFPAGASIQYHYSRLPEIRPGAGKLYNWWNDYDNGIAQWMDGPLINKPDEGNQTSTDSAYTYFSWNFDPTLLKGWFFSPSRLVPSAGMLGSLPTGVKRHTPNTPHAWETLLFRPEVRQHNGQPHPGTQSPKDHLLMDLFWMPVVEPYAISEPFSTAGKINMNYQIAPFTYIRRATAMHGALKSEQPLVLINSGSKVYRLWDHETNDWPLLPNASGDQDAQVRTDWNNLYNGNSPFEQLRRSIDPVQTLQQADTRFAQGDIFRSATEICELHLVRQNEQLSDYTNNTIWDNALPTGDNTRERPYTNLYAKLTTRSNVYNVHYRVQMLKKSPATSAAQWDESKDRVLGEFRGSSMIERYIDPGTPNLPDFTAPNSGNLDSYYKFRVVSTKKFAP